MVWLLYCVIVIFADLSLRLVARSWILKLLFVQIVAIIITTNIKVIQLPRTLNHHHLISDHQSVASQTHNMP
jgi:hypothetical protein